ncbi:uncharacterized protein LOC133176917 [Saccostrea echinata]|uniref:uncharacterized protein LOC133176917 n=1 Tax=Saccostrea echinata TaxID=191078 RepID=UPI002A8056A3|nr:uncharacterized protein LOC133176917 [Saccostrea echinata]
MADDKMRCSFGDNCDENTLVLLKECKKDTTSHARYLKCSTEDIHIPESVLILNRAGVMGLGLSNLYKHVCLKHRNILGLHWKRNKRTYCHPLHDKSKSSTIARGVTVVQSREIWLKLNVVLPIGSGICRRCIETHKKEISMGIDLKEELKEMCSLLEKTANASNQTGDHLL